METLKVKKLTETAKLPVRSSSGAAGFDMCIDSFEMYGVKSDTCPMINVGDTVMIHTGISMAIPKGHVSLLYPRSGLACKHGLRLSNSVGVIDEDYRGEYIVMLHRDPIGDRDADSKPIDFLKKGDRIAQVIITEYKAFPVEEVNDLDETQRASGGFGSTGIH